MAEVGGLPRARRRHLLPGRRRRRRRRQGGVRGMRRPGRLPRARARSRGRRPASGAVPPSASAAGSSANAVAAPDPPDRAESTAAPGRTLPRPRPDDLLADHGGWPGLLTELLAGHDLSAEQARAAMATILSGHATAAQLIGFVVALRAKGETADELSGLLDAVLAAAELVPLSDDLRARAVDIVGTGGDRSHSINVSTMAALVVGRRRRAGVQARGARRVVAVRDGRRARSARRRHRADAGRRAPLRRGGRHRLLLRPAVPPGVPLRRAGARGRSASRPCSTCSARWPTRDGCGAS